MKGDYDNAEHPNQLHLKHDHHVGFDLDSVCRDCVTHNNLRPSGLEPGDRLSC